METTSLDQTLPPETYWLADESDVWLRHILENGAVRSTVPRFKANYLAGKLEPVANRPWEGEISGRLLSVANDIREKAEKDVAVIQSKSIKFRHVIYIKVEEARNIPDVDIYAEPNDDKAHANLVVKKLVWADLLDENATPKLSHPFVQNICDKILVCDASDLTSLEALRAA